MERKLLYNFKLKMGLTRLMFNNFIDDKKIIITLYNFTSCAPVVYGENCVSRKMNHVPFYLPPAHTLMYIIILLLKFKTKIEQIKIILLLLLMLWWLFDDGDGGCWCLQWIAEKNETLMRKTKNEHFMWKPHHDVCV